MVVVARNCREIKGVHDTQGGNGRDARIRILDLGGSKDTPRGADDQIPKRRLPYVEGDHRHVRVESHLDIFV